MLGRYRVLPASPGDQHRRTPWVSPSPRQHCSLTGPWQLAGPPLGAQLFASSLCVALWLPKKSPPPQIPADPSRPHREHQAVSTLSLWDFPFLLGCVAQTHIFSTGLGSCKGWPGEFLKNTDSQPYPVLLGIRWFWWEARFGNHCFQLQGHFPFVFSKISRHFPLLLLLRADRPLPPLAPLPKPYYPVVIISHTETSTRHCTQ